MRISDWSSDVCSSDLVVIKLECATEQRLELHTVRHGGIGREAFDAREHKGGFRGEVVARESVQRGLHGGQIGKGLGLGHPLRRVRPRRRRSEEHTSELQSLMRISYAVFCLKKKKQHNTT